MSIRVVNVVGARPNFMKIAPMMEQFARTPEIEPLLVHTGQHYDERMSELFFRQLQIPKPDINLADVRPQIDNAPVFCAQAVFAAEQHVPRRGQLGIVRKLDLGAGAGAKDEGVFKIRATQITGRQGQPLGRSTSAGKNLRNTPQFSQRQFWRHP